MEPRAARRLALGIACALALALQARFVLEQSRASRQPADDFVEAWLASLAELPSIPAAERVGFVTTVNPGQPEARLFLTRYALAPRIVVQGTAARLVVGHFRSPAEAEEVARRDGLSILGGSGDGLFLMWRPAP